MLMILMASSAWARSEFLACNNLLYPQVVPRNSEVVIVDYPKVGKGFAYRFTKKDNFYAKKFTANSDGVIQIPGLPPIYEQTIDGQVYTYMPHIDVYNAYLGRYFFVPYTSSDDEPTIDPELYWRIISYDQYPIAIVNWDVTSLTHDMFAHGLLMAIMKDHPVWKKTVDIVKRALAAKDSLGTAPLTARMKKSYLKTIEMVFNLLTIWEVAANDAKIYKATTIAERDQIVAAAVRDVTAVSDITSSLQAAEKLLAPMESKLRMSFVRLNRKGQNR